MHQLIVPIKFFEAQQITQKFQSILHHKILLMQQHQQLYLLMEKVLRLLLQRAAIIVQVLK